MTHEVRLLTSADAAALAALRRQAHGEATLGDPSKQQHSYSPAGLAEDLGDDTITYGYFDDGVLIGACTVVVRGTYPGESEGLLRGLLVDRLRRGHRVGRKLVAHCLQHSYASSLSEFALELRFHRENPMTKARRLYQLFGFTVKNAASGSRVDPEDGYLLDRMVVERADALARLLVLRRACLL